MNSNYLTFQHLEAEYYAGKPVLKDINFTINEGSYCAVIGSNGSGKSTLLKLIARLITPSKGKLVNCFKNVAYLPQNNSFNQNFPISIADVLKTSRYIRSHEAYTSNNLQNALDTVKLSVPLESPISDLSGGQFQRVLFARLLLQNPDLLLLDEPFNGIDENTIHDLADVLNNLYEKKKTILIAIHDWHFVNKFVPMILEGKNGHFHLYHNQNLSEKNEC